jgi:catechol 2,3-dioxygenase-like lactoylglutathione lyase family enzyme
MKMTRLIPMLPVKSMPASVDFYCVMLGFEVETRNDDWGWAMLRFDECLVHWHDEKAMLTIACFSLLAVSAAAVMGERFTVLLLEWLLPDRI